MTTTGLAKIQRAGIAVKFGESLLDKAEIIGVEHYRSDEDPC